MSEEKTVKCAMCRKEIQLRPHNEHFPFCSEKCRMQDLGNWLSESYAIPVGQTSTERSLPGRDD